MKQYDKISGFYDQVISGKDATAPYVTSRLQKFFPEAKTLLELGCGTGDVLKGLKTKFRLTGIDSSREMLKIARGKLPRAEFLHGDIRAPIRGRKFDAVICVYDTLNHVPLFSGWKKVFRSASAMLDSNGIFIFDVNTPYKLSMLEGISPMIHSFRKHFLIIDVSRISSTSYNWNLKIFENTGNDNFRLVECDIEESVFDAGRIASELYRNFELLRIEDEDGKRISDTTHRIYFVCRKKS